MCWAVPACLLTVLGVATVSLAVQQGPKADASAKPPIRLGPGPHLFVDDFLVETSTKLVRKVNSPRRDLPKPVVTAREDKNFQPYVTVLRDPKTRRFRMWYNVPEHASQSHLAYLESEDGIHWIRPHRVLADPAEIQFGASVIDEGPDCSDPAKRFRFAWWKDGGLQVATSRDGLTWNPIVPGVVLRHNHDISSIFRDPIRNRYVAMVSGYTEGDSWSGRRRVIMQSVSDDLVHWAKPWYVITPDDRVDEGETQFYCMGGLVARGDLLIGMVRVLRDDLPADADGPIAGIGYTTLAWSRDGENWTWDREVFFDRDHEAGAWDHAMAWIDCQLPVGDRLYLYYGGYARGHKIERFSERQIGLVRMPRDRYVAREAGDSQGTLRTPLLVLEADEITLNVDARGGTARGQIVGTDGRPIPGFAFEDCKPITTNTVAAPLQWKRPPSALGGRAVCLQFALRRARLFGFEL